MAEEGPCRHAGRRLPLPGYGASLLVVSLALPVRDSLAWWSARASRLRRLPPRPGEQQPGSANAGDEAMLVSRRGPGPDGSHVNLPRRGVPAANGPKSFSTPSKDLVRPVSPAPSIPERTSWCPEEEGQTPGESRPCSGPGQVALKAALFVSKSVSALATLNATGPDTPRCFPVDRAEAGRRGPGRRSRSRIRAGRERDRGESSRKDLGCSCRRRDRPSIVVPLKVVEMFPRHRSRAEPERSAARCSTPSRCRR